MENEIAKESVEGEIRKKPWERIMSLQRRLVGIEAERCQEPSPVARRMDFLLAFLSLLIETNIQGVRTFLSAFKLDKRKWLRGVFS